MRPITLFSALALVASPAAASVLGNGGTAAVARRQEIEARNEPSLPRSLENNNLMPRWEDGSETFGWPADSVGRGTVDYQFVVTNLGNKKYRVQLYHSGPANGSGFKFTFTAPGISVVKTLKPRSSTSFEVAEAGEGFQVIVERS